MYSAPSDEELDAIISEIQLSHPNTGYRMMKAFLHARGMLVQSKFDIKLILICTYALLDLSNNNSVTIECRVDPKRQETSEQFNKGLFQKSKNSKRAASGSSTGSGGWRLG